MSVSTMGTEDVKIDREEFETFVETMKTKENIQKIMRGLQSTAPEIYEAMVAERDIYMGRGLDELGLNLKDSSAENTVAVMVREVGLISVPVDSCMMSCDAHPHLVFHHHCHHHQPGDGSCGWSGEISGFERMGRDKLPLPSVEMKVS